MSDTETDTSADSAADTEQQPPSFGPDAIYGGTKIDPRTGARVPADQVADAGDAPEAVYEGTQIDPKSGDRVAADETSDGAGERSPAVDAPFDDTQIDPRTGSRVPADDKNEGAGDETVGRTSQEPIGEGDDADEKPLGTRGPDDESAEPPKRTLEELHHRATELEIEGRSKMGHDELEAAVREAEASKDQ